MTMIRKLVRAQMTAVGDDEVDVVMSTAALARDGHILLPQGAMLDNYRLNPIVLWAHDPDHPVGNAENISINADNITARVRFAPIGTTRKADETRGLVKSGVVRAVSVGFDPLDGVPLDPTKPRGGQRVTKWELLEFSFVSIPSDTGAVVIARADGGVDLKEKADMEDCGPKAQEARRAKLRAAGIPEFKRGLYDVAQLAYLLNELGYVQDMAVWEAALEKDDSKVPAMLGEVLMAAGEALVAMTQEEVGELLAGHGVIDEQDDEVLVVEERDHIASAKAPNIRAWRRGVAHAKFRAGKTLSDETIRCLREAQDCHAEGITHNRAAMKAHKQGIQTISDLMDRAGASLDESDVVADADPQNAPNNEGGRSADFRRRQADKLALSAAH